jgi:exosortase A-associated hydrolase 1
MTVDPSNLEVAMTFACVGEQLVGVLTRPARDASHSSARIGVLILVGGPQYRAGSHRQFTQLARALARAGYPSLRFDVRGMGDSSGPLQTFEHLSNDIAAALDAAQKQLPQVERWVLWGLCDGASAALMYMDDSADRRVHALCLANPWIRSIESLARTHVRHYYGRRLMQADFWRKLAVGGVGHRALLELGSTLHALWSNRRRGRACGALGQRHFRQRMVDGLSGFDGPVLLLLSEDDFTAKEFIDQASANADWQRTLMRPTVQRIALPRADHTFSDRASEQQMHEALLNWLDRLDTTTPHAERPQSLPACG